MVSSESELRTSHLVQRQVQQGLQMLALPLGELRILDQRLDPRHRSLLTMREAPVELNLDYISRNYVHGSRIRCEVCRHELTLSRTPCQDLLPLFLAISRAASRKVGNLKA